MWHYMKCTIIKKKERKLPFSQKQFQNVMFLKMWMFFTTWFRQCPQIEQQYVIKNKAAIALKCISNVELIAALSLIPYSSLIWGDNIAFLHTDGIVWTFF